jgi:hypothetical protein
MRISMPEAQESLEEIVNSTIHNKEWTILADQGKDVAAIITIEDLEFLEYIEDKMDSMDAEAAMREIAIHGTISFADFKKELGR